MSEADAGRSRRRCTQAVEGELGRQFTAGREGPGVPTAGKSGTAELGGKGEPHSWFIGFAPVDDPTVAIAVLVERGGRGGERAAPLAGDLLERYFELYADARDAAAPSRAVPLRGDDRHRPIRPRPRARRPLVERLGMAAHRRRPRGAVRACVAVAAFLGGEPFLGVMAAIGCLMVLWVGGLTLFRG